MELASLPERIKSKIAASENGCWLWTASGLPPQINWNGEIRRTHTLLWEMAYGSIPTGGWFHRSCGSRKCVNPSHMELVNRHKNTLRSLIENNRDIPSLMRWVTPVTESGCWIWTRFCNQEGYGQLTGYGNRKQYAHRLFYQHYKGAIPDDLELDHLCRVRCCVNPDHLEAVTPRINLLRGNGMSARYAKRTHCHNGHLLSGDNLLKVSTRPNTRVCKTCRRNRDAQLKFKRMEAV